MFKFTLSESDPREHTFEVITCVNTQDAADRIVHAIVLDRSHGVIRLEDNTTGEVTILANACYEIEGLDLSVRSYNCLIRAGYTTIEDLKKLSLDDLLSIRNLGLRSAKEILTKVCDHALAERMAQRDAAAHLA